MVSRCFRNLVLLVVGSTADGNGTIANGNSGCPCIAVGPAQIGTGTNTWVTAEYGYTCKAHDDGNGDCASATADELKAGGTKDWCKHNWCIVDPNNCAMRTRAVGYTTNATDFFSYETCGATAAPFNGNSWTGTVKCSWDQLSYCTADENGKTNCQCKPPASRKTDAAGKYGYGCMVHDNGDGLDHVSCANATVDELKDGGAKDWCKDKWCIVDASTCKLDNRELGGSMWPPHYSFATCNSTFAGNSLTGTEACIDKPTSFCTADENVAIRGSAGCPCTLPAKTWTNTRLYKGTTYGYGCRAHDSGKKKFCIVDKNNCDHLVRLVVFGRDGSNGITGYVSDKTCNAGGTTAAGGTNAAKNTDTSIGMSASFLALVIAAMAVQSQF